MEDSVEGDKERWVLGRSRNKGIRFIRRDTSKQTGPSG